MMRLLRVLEQLGGRRVAYMGPLPHTQSSESRPRRPFVECVCVSGCGVGVPHPIGGSALVNLVVDLDRGGGPPGIGFWSIRIQWMVSESGAKNDGFWWSGTGLGIGCLSIRI